jgi:transcriptional regulator with XRE-family HTH domain
MEHKHLTAFDPSAVRAEMARRGLNVEKLVELSGLSRSALDKILGPNGNPTVESLTKIATALGVDIRLFFALDSHHRANSLAESK